MRRTAVLAPALTAVVLLAGCTTAVSGTGRPGPGARGTDAGSSASASPSASGSGGGSGGGDALDLWNDVADAVADLPAVTVSGPVSGAGFGESTDLGATSVEASYGSDDGEPLAQVTVTTTKAGVLEVRATGGTAWVKASAAALQAYGYTPEEATAAGDRWAVMTDDDKGIDVFASLAAFLLICGPDESDDDLTATPGSDDTVVLASDLVGGSLTITTDPARIVTSEYSGDDLTFDYPSTALTVEAPPAAEVVTVPGF